MANYSDEVTDKSLKKLEKKIAKEYASAYEDMKEKADAYFNTLDNVRYQKEYEAYLNGVYTKQQFDAWYATQVQRGKGYEKMRDDLAYRMVNANQVASAYVNDKTPGIYALNYNYSAYEIAQAYGVSFDIYDEQTVKRLITGENAIEFRTLKVNPVRDYEWNREQINSALLNGILTGKDLNELSSSFLTVMKRNENSAMRNARTAYTSAQNGGRMQSYKKAEAMGIKMEKEWLATLDSRTRDSHQMLDGERVAVNETFSNHLEYPGDPSGAPAEVYNCRCTMKSILPDVNDEKRKTYSDWIEEQRSDQNMKKKYQSDEQKKLQNILKKWDILKTKRKVVKDGERLSDSYQREQLYKSRERIQEASEEGS